MSRLGMLQHYEEKRHIPFSGLESLSVSVAMMYVNAIVNGMQGCLLFLLYCLFNPTLRERIEASGSHLTALKSSSWTS